MQTTALKIASSIWRTLPVGLRKSDFAISCKEYAISALNRDALSIQNKHLLKSGIRVEQDTGSDIARAWAARMDSPQYAPESSEQSDGLLQSSICTERVLLSDVFQDWAVRMGDRRGHKHRKIWEWGFIVQALKERDCFQSQKTGLGFAVGTEPLTALFAAEGAAIVATDLYTEAAQAKGWVDSDQHAQGFEAINGRKLCDEEELRRLVEFKFADMNDISSEFDGKFDFVWSSCAFEHLGSLDQGKAFVYNAMKCLKPGGIAVHTTEYNLSSNTKTVDSGSTVLFRKQDIEDIINTLRSQGHKIDMDWNEGGGYADGFVDVPPYVQETHLRLQIEQYVVTSIGLIIQKAA